MENEERTPDTVFQELQSSFNQATPQSQRNLFDQLLQWIKQQEESISKSKGSDVQAETDLAVERSVDL